MSHRQSHSEASKRKPKPRGNEPVKPRRIIAPHGFAYLPILVACAALFAQTRNYGLLGWDCYPIIITSRVESAANFVGNFTEKLMDGRYTSDFYRPVLNCSFALDHAIWGLEPFGYQLTNLLLFAGCGVSICAMVRRLTGHGSWIAASFAGVFFALHPLQFEVLPVPPRRPEILCCLFMVLSLYSQLSPKRLAMKRPPILPAVFAMLAIGSKETALVLGILSFLVVWLYGRRSGLSGRLLQAVTALIPHVVGVGLMVAARFAVLGGMGGHRTVAIDKAVLGAPGFVRTVGEILLFPQPIMRTAAAAVWLPAGLAAGLALTCGLVLWRRRPRAVVGKDEGRLWRTGAVGLTWVVVLALTYSASGSMQPWYFLIPVAGWAMFLAALVDGLLSVVRRKDAMTLVPSVASLVLLTIVIGWQMRYSPVVHRYDEWARATTASEEFLGRLKARIEESPDGVTVTAPPIPTWVRGTKDAASIWGAAVLTDYSVQAWAELVFPDRRVRVVKAATNSRQPAVDEVVVVLSRRPGGF